MKKNKLFILGAEDPEMVAIQQLIMKMDAGEFVYACDPKGDRVIPSSAYGQTSISEYKNNYEPIWENTDVYLVECGNPGLPSSCNSITVIDHHHPGDSGYGKPPSKYWEASSIGQVYSVITSDQPEEEYLMPEEEYLMIAAADHCLAAAYAGQCQDIDPMRLWCWRIIQRADFQDRSYSEVRSDSEHAFWYVLHAPKINLGGVEVADLRATFVPELPEAACYLGVGYLSAVIDRDGRQKVVIGGCGEGTQPGKSPVETFLQEWGPAQGLTGLYGDPVRGFAGGYL